LDRIKILIVSDPSLARLIGHLFSGCVEFEISGPVRKWADSCKFGRPDLIVVQVKPLSPGFRRTVASIRASSPASKVILICSGEAGLPGARRHGADAWLQGETLTGRLLRTARTLAARSP